MRGLRALCCSKGDRNDDTQNAPVRLAQPPPAKTTQNVPTSEKKKASSTDVTVTPEKPTTDESVQLTETPTQQTPAPRDLW
ncbi:hypothetical protein N7488_012310 [Penicillium malachiteum]|nr:hypothetical protein N7488_012310 [Penicillium malachiteum]